MKHTNIEAAVFEKELESISIRIGNHVAAIREILGEYLTESKIPLDNPKRAEEVNHWLNNTPLVSTGYYAGYFAHASQPTRQSIPEVLKDAIKAKALSDFMAKVESISEIQQAAEQALYQSNQQ